MATSMMATAKTRMLIVALIALIGMVGLVGSVAGQSASESDPKTFSIDVAEDMSRFVFDTDVAYEDGMPKHGSSFITQGYIYPAGTLKDGNGVLADGSPEFPDLVLGEWTCRGWFVGEGAHATSGPMVITTQIYNFGDVLGAETLVTDGYELADIGVAVQRAITGGTGEYTGAEGIAKQTFHGFNASEGVNITVEFAISES